MPKETSAHVSTIGSALMHISAGSIREMSAPEAAVFAAKVRALAASCLSQDETPGQQPPEHGPHKIPETFIDRLLTEREDLQEKHGKLLLFLDRGAPGASEMQRHLLSLQICAMTNYGDTLDRRLEDLEFPTGDLDPFDGPALNNVGMENIDAD